MAEKGEPMQTPMLLALYCVLILLASLAGGWIPMMIRLTHLRLQLAVSLVAGVMLGVSLLHLLPHALYAAPGGMHLVCTGALLGFLVMFFIERFFCFHHHDLPEAEAVHRPGDAFGHLPPAGSCSHVHFESHRLTWGGAAVGLSLHTVINGMALAAAVEVSSHDAPASALAGLGTFLVIFLHKPFDAMTISTLMTVGGWSVAARHVVNALFALMIPVGVGLFHIGLGSVHAESHFAAYALAFSAGTFLCIASSDLLPELQFHGTTGRPCRPRWWLGWLWPGSSDCWRCMGTNTRHHIIHRLSQSTSITMKAHPNAPLASGPQSRDADRSHAIRGGGTRWVAPDLGSLQPRFHEIRPGSPVAGREPARLYRSPARGPCTASSNPRQPLDRLRQSRSGQEKAKVCSWEGNLPSLPGVSGPGQCVAIRIQDRVASEWPLSRAKPLPASGASCDWVGGHGTATTSPPDMVESRSSTTKSVFSMK